jgi:hypothetical protein
MLCCLELLCQVVVEKPAHSKSHCDKLQHCSQQHKPDGSNKTRRHDFPYPGAAARSLVQPSLPPSSKAQLHTGCVHGTTAWAPGNLHLPAIKNVSIDRPILVVDSKQHAYLTATSLKAASFSTFLQ